MNHALANSVGVLIAAIAIILGGVWYGGQLDAQIKENSGNIERISKENKEGFAELKEAITKLQEKNTNTDLAVLQTKVQHLEEQLKSHDHNGTYAQKEHDHPHTHEEPK